MKGSNSGFSLVEILVVVILLGILAAVVIPRFTDASDDANNAAVATNIDAVQGQVEIFRAQNGRYPRNLNELVRADMIREVPSGLSYDRSTGLVSASE
jgi:type II secretion system protein G